MNIIGANFRLRGRNSYTFTPIIMPTAEEIRKQVQELTATLARAEAAEKVEVARKETERRRKEEAKKKEEEMAQQTKTVMMSNKRKASRPVLVVPDSESESSEIGVEAEKSCTTCIKRGCKCIMVQVSKPHFLSTF